MNPNQRAFDQAYWLQPGQCLLRIKPPFVEGRMDFYRTAEPHQAKSIPHGPASMFLNWQDDKPVIHGMSFGRGFRSFEHLLQMLLNVFPQDVEGHVNLLTTEVAGDFLFRIDAAENEHLIALGAIISDELKARIMLTLRDVEREVVVLNGKWHYTAVDKVAQRRKCVEHYGRDLNVRREGNGGGSGDAHRWARHLGQRINRTVIVEAEQVPQSIRWKYNDRGDGSEESLRRAHDAKLVLKHIHEQTGLSASEQIRTVRRLFIEHRSG